MRILKGIYRLVNTLSLDVCAGVVCCCLFFAKVSGTSVDPISLVVLALTVWLIYTLDHIRDSSRMKKVPSQYRHRFHLTYRTPLLIAVAIITVCNIILVFKLPLKVILAGAGLGIAIGLYLTVLPVISRAKEALVAFFYTAGMLVPVFFDLKLNYMMVLLIASFFLLAFMNLVLLSYFEVEYDIQDNMPSLVILLGESKSRELIHTLFILVSICLPLAGFNGAILVIWGMAFIHYLVFRFHSMFMRNEAFRFVSEATFLIPLLFVLLS